MVFPFCLSQDISSLGLSYFLNIFLIKSGKCLHSCAKEPLFPFGETISNSHLFFISGLDEKNKVLIKSF